MNAFHFLAALILGMLASPAVARTSVPLKDFTNQGITASRGQELPLADIKAAIIRGANVRGWALKEISPHEFEATIVVRGKHTVGVNITYDVKAFSIRYRTSNDMNYSTEKGRPVIHPKYNEWVSNLVGDIRKELATL